MSKPQPITSTKRQRTHSNSNASSVSGNSNSGNSGNPASPYRLGISTGKTMAELSAPQLVTEPVLSRRNSAHSRQNTVDKDENVDKEDVIDSSQITTNDINSPATKLRINESRLTSMLSLSRTSTASTLPRLPIHAQQSQEENTVMGTFISPLKSKSKSTYSSSPTSASTLLRAQSQIYLPTSSRHNNKQRQSSRTSILSLDFNNDLAAQQVDESRSENGTKIIVPPTNDGSGDLENENENEMEGEGTITQRKYDALRKKDDSFNDDEQDDDHHASSSRVTKISFKKRRYYVLTNAGKLVYNSSYRDHQEHKNQDADENEDDGLINMMGVAQAIISIYAGSAEGNGGDKLRSIQSGNMRIVFLLRDPLYLFCVSDWGEPEYVLRTHLEYLYLQMISVVTEGQLKKAFQRRSNFDLRRLLEGTETFCDNLIHELQSDFTYMTNTLQPLRMNSNLRDRAAELLIPPSKVQDLLYVLLVAGGKIVTLLRPRRHSIHPTDLHLLLNILSSSPALRTTETWLPICLPKFNPEGFVYAFISYLNQGVTTEGNGGGDGVKSGEVGMVFVSADREGFEQLRNWKEVVESKLKQDRILSGIEHALKSSDYTVGGLAIPGLRHFFFKSRKNVQITCPIWDGVYSSSDSNEGRRTITMYQRVYDGIHAKSGQGGSLKQLYIRSDDEACMGWITQPFELYISVSPDLPKSSVIAAANAVVRWVNKEESRIFLREAPVF